MKTSLRQTIAEIDLGSLKHNLSELRKLASPQAFHCPMIKANAYGHGDKAVAASLRAEGVRHLGVVMIEEGENLRSGGDRGDVLIFNTFSDRDSAEALLRAKLTPVAADWKQLEVLKETLRAGERTKIHIDFNTGMNRLGFEVSEASRIRSWLEQNPVFELEGVCSHLVRGEDAGSGGDRSSEQLHQFNQALVAFQGLKFHPHLLNSAGSAAFHARKVKSALPLGMRPGIALYGEQPSETHELALNLRPVLKWKTKLVSLHNLEVGETVSYNATWRAERQSLIGVLPVGYGDGYRRGLSNQGTVLVRGHAVPVAGIVCMDYFMIDLTDVRTRGVDFVPGEDVVLIGEQNGPDAKGRITATDLARRLGTISYEILTGISSRVPRVYLPGGA